jgi:uncharacterized protein YyaL (SSP411 family)
LRERIGNAGGFPRQGLQELYPLSWLYLVMAGDMESLESSLGRLLLSPMADPIDGGFFRLMNLEDHSLVLNKISTNNAEMLQTLMITALLSSDPVYEAMARRTFNYLALGIHVDGRMAAYQVEDIPRAARNRRHSLGPRKQRELLDAADREWLASHLQFGSTNPMMLPYAPSAEVLLDPQYRRLLSKMRQNLPPPKLSGTGYLEVEAHVAARLLAAARLSGEDAWQELAMQRAAAATEFLSAEGLRRRLDSEGTTDYLGDYLAFADLKLQEYLLTGNGQSLKSGFTQLVEAEVLFRGERAGEYPLTRRHLLPDTHVPEIADNFRESGSARMLRLATHYERLLNIQHMRKVRDAVLAKFAFASTAGAAEIGGYMCAALDAMEETYALVAGPNAVRVATALARLAPTRFVAPEIGEVHGMEPGIHVFREGVRSGPLNMDQAARLLNQRTGGHYPPRAAPDPRSDAGESEG